MRRALVPHPDFRCDAVGELSAEAWREGARLRIRYLLRGAIGELAIPPPGPRERTDGLWRHTCFEAFVAADADAAYVEANFCPSGQWAVYRFDAPRQGMAAAEVPPPAISVSQGPEALVLTAALELDGLPGLAGAASWRLGLTAVIEEKGGRLSYWALAHAAARPDFHNPEGFVLDLPVTDRP